VLARSRTPRAGRPVGKEGITATLAAEAGRASTRELIKVRFLEQARVPPVAALEVGHRRR
jgi:RNA-binding protein YhbY